MADNTELGRYLAGEDEGAELTAEERAGLDRVRGHLGNAALWDEPQPEGQFRLLAAAAAEAAQGPSSTPQPDQYQTQAQTPDQTLAQDPVRSEDSSDPVAGSRVSRQPSVTPVEPRVIRPLPGSQDAKDHDSYNPLTEQSSEYEQPIDLQSRRNRPPRGRWFAAGMAAAAAVVAVAAFSATQFGGVSFNGETDELEVVASVELSATELDPDAAASVDIMPTPAGVQLELMLMGLDNAEGDDYYAAWLLPTAGSDDAMSDGDMSDESMSDESMSDDAMSDGEMSDGEMANMGEAIPLGSFHWRQGGVTIILWSGVDDPSYGRFLVTRQRLGDGGTMSADVVLTGELPVLTADG